jgi:hypothetical protein
MARLDKAEQVIHGKLEFATISMAEHQAAVAATTAAAEVQWVTAEVVAVAADRPTQAHLQALHSPAEFGAAMDNVSLHMPDHPQL